MFTPSLVLQTHDLLIFFYLKLFVVWRRVAVGSDSTANFIKGISPDICGREMSGLSTDCFKFDSLKIHFILRKSAGLTVDALMWYQICGLQDATSDTKRLNPSAVPAYIRARTWSLFCLQIAKHLAISRHGDGHLLRYVFVRVSGALLIRVTLFY